MSLNVRSLKTSHSQLSVLYLFYFLPLLQQVFCNLPANQIMISTYN